jgi:CPA2 family monovalent cation:H+ antiporter-2
MVADPASIIRNWYVVAAVVAALTVGKFLVIWAIFRFLGQTNRVAAATGLCLAQIGEFAFVLGAIGLGRGVVSEDVYSLIVSVAIVSFFLSAILVPAAPGLANRLVRWLRFRESDPESSAPAQEPPDVAIVGFGPAGQLAAGPLVDQDLRVVVIDLEKRLISKARQLGFHAELGDATQTEVLEHARLKDCKAVVITVPHFRSAMTILEHVRRNAPHTWLMVRSRYELHTGDFNAAGANAVLGDEHNVGEAMSKHLQEWLARFERQPRSPDDPGPETSADRRQAD